MNQNDHRNHLNKLLSICSFINTDSYNFNSIKIKKNKNRSPSIYVLFIYIYRDGISTTLHFHLNGRHRKLCAIVRPYNAQIHTTVAAGLQCSLFESTIFVVDLSMRRRYINFNPTRPLITLLLNGAFSEKQYYCGFVFEVPINTYRLSCEILRIFGRLTLWWLK